MMLLTVAFVAYQAKRRTKMTKIKKWGPTIITACAGNIESLLRPVPSTPSRTPPLSAAFFVIADPMRTVILDGNIDVCCITEFTGDQCINAGNAST
jgi:hypothetical protein